MFVHARITFTNPGAPIMPQHLHRGHYRTTSDARLAKRRVRSSTRSLGLGIPAEGLDGCMFIYLWPG